jgi:hypothetical protein
MHARAYKHTHTHTHKAKGQEETPTGPYKSGQKLVDTYAASFGNYTLHPVRQHVPFGAKGLMHSKVSGSASR